MEKCKNLTIDDIARDLGVSKTTVSRAISGKVALFSNDMNYIVIRAALPAFSRQPTP